MITLKEALALCRVGDDEVVYFFDGPNQNEMWCWPMTGKEVREQYDMRKTMVTEIKPKFICLEYESFAFVIKKPDQNVPCKGKENAETVERVKKNRSAGKLLK